MSTYKLATKTRDEQDIASGYGKYFTKHCAILPHKKREKKISIFHSLSLVIAQHVFFFLRLVLRL
jgi:hypothetical protein